MSYSEETWQRTMEQGIMSVFPGIKKVFIIEGGEYGSCDVALAALIKKMRGLKAEEVLAEGGGESLLVVKYDYGDTFAAVSFSDDVSPAGLSRLIRLTLARRGGLQACDKAFMPAEETERLIKRWEKRIGLAFGEEFSIKLVESRLSGKDRASMSPGELDGIRASISSALGDCLLLDKVNK